MGPLDAAIRVAVALVLILLAAWFNSAPLPAMGFAALGLFVFETARTRACPLYTPLGIDTSPEDD